MSFCSILIYALDSVSKYYYYYDYLLLLFWGRRDFTNVTSITAIDAYTFSDFTPQAAMFSMYVYLPIDPK